MIHVQGKFPIKEFKVRGTKPNDIWTVELFGDYRMRCNCPVFVYKMQHFCKHTQAKRLEIEQEFGNIKNYVESFKN